MADDDQSEWEQGEAAEARVRGFVQAYDRFDLLLAAFVSAVAWTLLTLLPYPVLHPQAWSAVAVAAGGRPPASPEAGLWTFLAHRTFILFGMKGGLMALTQIGHVVGALIAGLSYLLMRGTFSARLSLEAEELSALAARLRILAVAAALVFSCSEAFWRLSQFFSDNLMCLLLGAVAILSFERFRWYRNRGWYCLCFFLIFKTDDVEVPQTMLEEYVVMRPNPATDRVQVFSSFNIRSIEVHNIAGQLVERRKVDATQTVLDVSAWEKGPYVVTITTPAGTVTRKLVVQ